MRWIEIIGEEQSLTELFKDGYPLKWLDVKFGRQDTARFRTDDGRNYEITFYGDKSGITVNFDQNGSMHATGGGSAGKVFTTVLQAIREYVGRHQPTKIKFSAVEPSRAKLYKAMISKLISEFPDYKLAGQNQTDGTNFIIAKKNFLDRLIRR